MESNIENMHGIPQELADKLPNCRIHPKFKCLFICPRNRAFCLMEEELYCRQCSVQTKKIGGYEFSIHNHENVYITNACYKFAL